MTASYLYGYEDGPSLLEAHEVVPPRIQRDETVRDDGGTHPITALYKHLGAEGVRRALEREQAGNNQADVALNRLLSDQRILGAEDSTELDVEVSVEANATEEPPKTSVDFHGHPLATNWILEEVEKSWPRAQDNSGDHNRE